MMYPEKKTMKFQLVLQSQDYLTKVTLAHWINANACQPLLHFMWIIAGSVYWGCQITSLTMFISVYRQQILLLIVHAFIYHIYSINCPERLLNFWTLKEGACLRWALIRGWALIQFPPFSGSVVCLFCNKTINSNNETRRCSKARFL